MFVSSFRKKLRKGIGSMLVLGSICSGNVCSYAMDKAPFYRGNVYSESPSIFGTVYQTFGFFSSSLPSEFSDTGDCVDKLLHPNVSNIYSTNVFLDKNMPEDIRNTITEKLNNVLKDIRFKNKQNDLGFILVDSYSIPIDSQTFDRVEKYTVVSTTPPPNSASRRPSLTPCWIFCQRQTDLFKGTSGYPIAFPASSNSTEDSYVILVNRNYFKNLDEGPKYETLINSIEIYKGNFEDGKHNLENNESANESASVNDMLKKNKNLLVYRVEKNQKTGKYHQLPIFEIIKEI